VKSILVTGVTGFVGRQIFKSLEKSNVNIVPVVRTGKESFFYDRPNVVRVVSTPDMFCEEAEWWQEQCKSVDIVIHSAWYVETGKCLESDLNMKCLKGSINLAEGAVKAGVKRFIGIGTCFEYDTSKGILSVDTPLNPHTVYGGAKVALYVALSSWLPAKSVEFAWCRLFYLYGETEDPRRLVSYLRRQLTRGQVAELTSGQQIRDFLDVSEAGRMIAEIAESDQQGPINVCSGVPITVRQLAEQIADEYGRRDLLKFGGRPDNLTDPIFILGVPNHGSKNRT
jgi:nucleoside-diphosphate-sugar epimerase